MNAPLQSVDRALVVLLSFDEHRADWGVTELAERFGWDKSVAQRLLATLARRGFLVSQPGTRRYRLGPAMWHLAWLWERMGGLSSVARPVLGRLARLTGYTALLAVPDGEQVRCVEAVDGESGPVRQYSLVGELYPAGQSGDAALAVPLAARNQPVGTLMLLGHDVIPADRHEELVDELHTAALEIGRSLTPRPRPATD